MTDFDAVIVGASLAGSATAIHLGRAGARVALVERKTDPNAFKRVCGHFIQASAVPALRRLGVLEELEALGAPRGRPRVWCPYGWIEPHGDRDEMRSLSIRREVLDPLLRRRAAETPGVELMLGRTVDGVEPGRVHVRDGGTLTAKLIVGADGRGSKTAKLAGLATRTRPNARFAYWGYFEGPPLGTGASVHIWFHGRDVGIVTPTDGGLMLYVAFPTLDRAPAFKRDIEGELRAFTAALPDAPPIAESKLVGPLVGKLDLTNEWRATTGRNIALVGDAALAADPVGAIGCGWALQSAEWLADAVTPALHGEEPLARGLKRYRRTHRRHLMGHSRMVAQAALAKPMNPLQKLIFSAAVRDPGDRCARGGVRVAHRPCDLAALAARARPGGARERC